MIEVVSVKFKNKGKSYFFDPNGHEISKGQHVIVETSKGLEYAECVRENHVTEDDTIVPPLRPVIRIATPEDDQRADENKKKEADAFRICCEKIAKYELDMKLVDVEYNFEGNKILFFFTSDGRVDFRELVKELASVFKTRIELRQIGVRDEARMLGGLGICGKPFCCAQFLDDFQPVSIKMAKTQGLSLNPTKISGSCGRLMCCLKYEQEAYEELVKNAPKVDAFVETSSGVGSVVDINLLRGTARVRLESNTDTALKTFPIDELKVLGGKAARAEYLAAQTEAAEQAKKQAEERLAEDASNRWQDKPEQRKTVSVLSQQLPESKVSEHDTQQNKEGQRLKNNRSTQSRNRAGDPKLRVEQKRQEKIRQEQVHPHQRLGRDNRGHAVKTNVPQAHGKDDERISPDGQRSAKSGKRHGGYHKKHYVKDEKAEK